MIQGLQYYSLVLSWIGVISKTQQDVSSSTAWSAPTLIPHEAWRLIF